MEIPLCLRVLAMGDHNAVDIAQEVHAGVLASGGVLLPDVFRNDRPVPHSRLIQGLYIDDLLIF